MRVGHAKQGVCGCRLATSPHLRLAAPLSSSQGSGASHPPGARSHARRWEPQATAGGTERPHCGLSKGQSCGRSGTGTPSTRGPPGCVSPRRGPPGPCLEGCLPARLPGSVSGSVLGSRHRGKLPADLGCQVAESSPNFYTVQALWNYKLSFTIPGPPRTLAFKWTIIFYFFIFMCNID